MTRLDLAQVNVDIIKEVAKNVVHYVKKENGHMLLSLKKNHFARQAGEAEQLEKHISRRLLPRVRKYPPWENAFAK